MALIFSSYIYDIILILTTTLIYAYIYFKKSFNYWKNRGISYIEPSIPFGNITPILLAKESIGSNASKIYQQLKNQNADFGGYFSLTRPIFMPVDPELVKRILVKDFTSFEERGSHYDEEIDPLSGHLFSVRNPKWYKLRMKFSPIFTQMKLKNMFPTMVECSKDLKSVLISPAETGECFDIKEVLARFSTDIISTCAFGIKCNSLLNPNAELRKVGHDFFKGSFRNSLVLTFAMIAPMVLKKLKIPICDPNAAKNFIDAIKYTVKTREEQNIERNDMINLLIKLKNEHDDDFDIDLNDISAQCFIFFLGGFETSSSAMCFAMYEISKNDVIQNKLREEILRVLKKYGDEVTYDALIEMNYLDKVVQETLRKYPPLPILNRECTKDYPIPGTDKIIEKGTAVVISALAMQRDPELFENPELFDPDRFSSERKDYINENTFVPFGLGPRNCIGFRFGTLQIKIGLIVLLKNYIFTLDPKTKSIDLNKKTLVLAFENTIWMKVSKLQ